MSDTSGNVLIEIQPDFSKFEAELTRGLQQAAQRAQKQAQVQLGIALEDKGAATHFKGISKSTEDMSKQFERLNANLERTANSLEQIARKTQNAGNRTRENTKRVQEQAGAFHKLFETMGNLAPLVQAAVTIDHLTKNIKGFINLRAGVSSFVGGLLEGFRKTEGETTRFGEFLKRTADKTKDFFEVVDTNVGMKKFSTKEFRNDLGQLTKSVITTEENIGNGIFRITDTVRDGTGKILESTVKEVGDLTHETQGGFKAVVGVINESRNAGQQAGATLTNVTNQAQQAANKARDATTKARLSFRQGNKEQLNGLSRSAAAFSGVNDKAQETAESFSDNANEASRLSTAVSGLTRVTGRLVRPQQDVQVAAAQTGAAYRGMAQSQAAVHRSAAASVTTFGSLALKIREASDSMSKKASLSNITNSLTIKTNDLLGKGASAYNRLRGNISEAGIVVSAFAAKMRNISVGIKDNNIVMQAHSNITEAAGNSSRFLGTAMLGLRAKMMQNTAVSSTQAAVTDKLGKSYRFLGNQVSGVSDKFGTATAPLQSFATGVGAIAVGVTKLGEGTEKSKQAVGGLRGIFNDLDKQLGKTRGRFAEMEQSSNLLTRAVGMAGTQLTSLPGLIGAAAVAVGIFTSKVSKAIVGLAQSASNLAEAENALSVTLGDADKPFRQLIGDTTALGMTQLDLNEAIVPIIPLMKNAGFAGEEFAQKLNLLVRRAVDVGSIMNKQTKDVLPALGAALRGEIDPAERLGISFNAMAVEAKATELGFKKVGGEFEESAKVQARLALVMQKSEVFAGDYARTSDQLANATRNYHSVVAGLRLEFSKAFLPAANLILKAQNELVTTVGPAVAALFAKLEPLVTAVGHVLFVLIEALKVTIQTFTEVWNVIGDGISAVVEPAIAAIQHFAEAYEPLITAIKKVVQFSAPVLKSILTISVAYFAVSRILGTVVAGLNLASAAMMRFGMVTQAANLQAIAGRFAALAGPLTAVAAGVVAIVVRLNQLDSSAKAAAKALTEKFADPSDMNAIGVAVGEFGTQIEKAKKNLEGGLQLKIGEFRIKPLKDVNKQVKDLAQLEKERSFNLKQLTQQQEVLGSVSKRTGESVKAVFARAVEAGIDFLHLPAEKKLATIESLVKGLDASAKALKKALDQVTSASKNLADYETALKATEASEKELKKLVTDRDKLVNNVIAKKMEEWQVTKAVRDAEQAITDSTKQREAEQTRLLTIATERKDLEQQIADLLKPPDPADVQAAQDAIVRAEIELARQSRRQLEIEEKKTDEKVKQTNELKEQQKVEVDLRGLSLREVKGRLASVRASLAAQRATAKEQEDEADTQDDIKETKKDELTIEEQQKLLDIDRRQAARDLVDRQKDLNALVNTQVTHATDVKGLQDRIKQLAEDEKTARETIDRLEKDAPGLILAKQSAEQTYKDTVLNKTAGIHADIKQLNIDILAKKEEIKTKEGEEQSALDKLKKTEEEILAIQQRKTIARLQELGILNEEIKTLSKNAKSQAFGVIRNAFINAPWIKELSGPLQRQVKEDAGFEVEAILNKPGFMEALVAGMVINPTVDITELLKQLFKEFGITSVKLAEGGLVRSHSIAQIGEGGLAEAVLPLTKPDRFAAVLRQSASYAHPQIQEMINHLDGESSRGRRTSSLSGAITPPSRKPSRLEQKLDRLIQLQEEANEKGINNEVNAPITINTKDSSRAVRQSVRELEKRLRRL